MAHNYTFSYNLVYTDSFVGRIATRNYEIRELAFEDGELKFLGRRAEGVQLDLKVTATPADDPSIIKEVLRKRLLNAQKQIDNALEALDAAAQVYENT